VYGPVILSYWGFALLCMVLSYCPIGDLLCCVWSCHIVLFKDLSEESKAFYKVKLIVGYFFNRTNHACNYAHMFEKDNNA